MNPVERSGSGGLQMRVVSLVPSSTETLLVLGADVIACTRFCEQPTIVHVGGTKNPDVAAIVALEPALVVLDREENRIEDHDALVAAGCDVFVSHVTDVDSAIAVVGRLADAAGLAAPQAPQVMWRRGEATWRRAFVPIWRRPWMTISTRTYGASVLQAIGIDLIDDDSADAYPTVDLDEVAERSPDLVIVPSEPYEFTESHLDEIRRAMGSAPVVRVDGQDLFWWGARTADAVNRLAQALAPPPTP